MCTGGAVNSELWNQIKSDISKKTLICISEFPTATLGAAILAGLGSGIYKKFCPFDFEYTYKNVFHPSADTLTRYDRLFDIYKKLYQNLKNEFNELAGIYS